MVSDPNLEHLEDNSRDITRNMLQNDGSLLIFYTRVADQGMYKCIATNILGDDVGEVNLTVREGEISLPFFLPTILSLTFEISAWLKQVSVPFSSFVLYIGHLERSFLESIM